MYEDGIGVDYGGSADDTGGGLHETVKLMISNNAMQCKTNRKYIDHHKVQQARKRHEEEKSVGPIKTKCSDTIHLPILLRKHVCSVEMLVIRRSFTRQQLPNWTRCQRITGDKVFSFKALRHSYDCN